MPLSKEDIRFLGEASRLVKSNREVEDRIKQLNERISDVTKRRDGMVSERNRILAEIESKLRDLKTASGGPPSGPSGGGT